MLCSIFELVQESTSLTSTRLTHPLWNAIALPYFYHSITLTHTLLTPSLRARLPNPTLIFRSIYLHTRRIKIYAHTPTPSSSAFLSLPLEPCSRQVTTILNKCRKLEAVTFVYPPEGPPDEYAGWTPSDLRFFVPNDSEEEVSEDSEEKTTTTITTTATSTRRKKKVKLLIEGYRLGYEELYLMPGRRIPTEFLVSLDVVSECGIGLAGATRRDLRSLVESCPRLQVLRYRDEEVTAVVKFSCGSGDDHGRDQQEEEEEEDVEFVGWLERGVWRRRRRRRRRKKKNKNKMVQRESGGRRCDSSRVVMFEARKVIGWAEEENSVVRG
ncbi:hypothetical protein QBC44DRAFT_160890 [Cladorrhinum sp. PSN332]|nr:hypothetical protein QBC44DRAFT_160890 [Cladorrhinum sp. PSN332]